jgi:hypothetical protein
VATDPRAAVERAARELLRALAELLAPPTLRVAEVEGGVACLIQVWDASLLMPTVGAERKRRATGGRAECKADILAVVRAAGRALTRKEVVRALRDAGKGHGAGTVAKALADLTATGELVNPRDKRGYRLAGWRRDKTPSLFD